MKLWVAVFSSVCSGRCGGAGVPVAGHPFAAGEGGMEWYGRSQAGSIRYVDRAAGGGQTCNDLASWPRRREGSHWSGQATDVPVA